MGVMRRFVAGLLVAIGLIFGSLAIFIHLTQLSLLQPGRLQQAASQLIASPAVRNALVGATATGINQYLPQGTYIPTQEASVVVDKVLSDPTVQGEFAAAMGNAQARLLGQTNQPIVLTGPAFTQAVVTALNPFSPQAASAVANSGITIPIPGANLPNLSKYVSWAPRLLSLFRALAILLCGVGLIIHPARMTVLSRISLWLIGISLLNALIFWFAPAYLLPSIGTSWAAIAAVILKAASGPAAAFYATLLGIGVIGLVSTKVLAKL